MEPLARLELTPEILKLVAELDEFKGRWEALGHQSPERLTSLQRVATVESVGSSTRIEGARLSNEQVDRLLSGLAVRSFRSRDEQEVAGYAEALELVFESHMHITLTENHIKQLHGELLKFSDKDERHRGQYKKQPNSVEAFDEDGRSLGVIFETATPFDTPGLMDELVTWTRRALDEGVHHPLLVIGLFVVRLLAIHPFQDGNGRLSRVLTTLLLLRAGYAYVPYSSLERVIEDNKDEYYRTLRAAQATLDRDESRLDEWLVFFLRCLEVQKGTLQAKIEEQDRAVPPHELDQQLLRIAREHGRITNRLAARVTGVSRNTIKLHLRKLVEAGQLLRHGKGKGTNYTLA